MLTFVRCLWGISYPKVLQWAIIITKKKLQAQFHPEDPFLVVTQYAIICPNMVKSQLLTGRSYRLHFFTKRIVIKFSKDFSQSGVILPQNASLTG